MRREARTPAPRRLLRLGHLVCALVLAAAWPGGTALAQTGQNNTAIVKIDFAFVAAGKEMPAGSYEFTVDNATIALRPEKTRGPAIVMPAFTRLGRHDTDPDPELVFDKVGGKLLLSEVWFPGQDGYLLLDTHQQHEHRVIGGSRPHQ